MKSQGMTSGKYTCDDQQVPKPATGKTPNRNLRSPDERWFPSLAKAEADGRSLSDVIDGYLAAYLAEPVPATRAFTLANWPEAANWAEAHADAIFALSSDLAPATGPLPVEWLSVAAWLASTRHPSNTDQQNRIITGHIVGRAIDEPEDSYWRGVHRDSRRLSQAVQEILERHLPLGEG
jgi:hypothetical protein